MVDGFLLGDVLEDALFAAIEGDAVTAGSDVAVVGVCIVNGPGEMTDADYGYVGAGR